MAPALSPTLSRLVPCHVHLSSAANDEGTSGQAGSDMAWHGTPCPPASRRSAPPLLRESPGGLCQWVVPVQWLGPSLARLGRIITPAPVCPLSLTAWTPGRATASLAESSQLLTRCCCSLSSSLLSSLLSLIYEGAAAPPPLTPHASRLTPHASHTRALEWDTSEHRHDPPHAYQYLPSPAGSVVAGQPQPPWPSDSNIDPGAPKGSPTMPRKPPRKWQPPHSS
jgi:hypothetical protein